MQGWVPHTPPAHRSIPLQNKMRSCSHVSSRTAENFALRSVGTKSDSDGQIQLVQHLMCFRRHPICPSGLKLNNQWWHIPRVSILTIGGQLAFLFQGQMEQTPRRGAEPRFSYFLPLFKGYLFFTKPAVPAPIKLPVNLARLFWHSTSTVWGLSLFPAEAARYE